ncbi:arylamine N-acetyltransferase [Actinoplanes sp. NBRC 101535]|uniref:arylamine N-acetyltransferase family protein n=1 Tax=Actinoplanes sp. NBRC 101535 TaxID=3032196 RepID=UPI0025571E14|nr:arylamine N-acetyltransferase [Actinoplanes sp. NBRC 101535]
MSIDVSAYLDRIGVAATGVPDASLLRELHHAHLRTVPFENLSIHQGERLSLDEDALIDKIIQRRRGGFCFELNGAFALLLNGLGYPVRRVAARVGQGPILDHLALLVTTPDDGITWLADVGFGSHSSYPLRLAERGVQQDPGGAFTLVDAAHGDVQVVRDGEPKYRLERRPRPLSDFTMGCWWHQTSPESHFTHKPLCTRLDGHDRITISDRTLIRTRGGEREETTLTDAALLAAYRDLFGITLDSPPTARHAAPAPA